MPSSVRLRPGPWRAPVLPSPPAPPPSVPGVGCAGAAGGAGQGTPCGPGPFPVGSRSKPEPTAWRGAAPGAGLVSRCSAAVQGSDGCAMAARGVAIRRLSRVTAPPTGVVADRRRVGALRRGSTRNPCAWTRPARSPVIGFVTGVRCLALPLCPCSAARSVLPPSAAGSRLLWLVGFLLAAVLRASCGRAGGARRGHPLAVGPPRSHVFRSLGLRRRLAAGRGSLLRLLSASAGFLAPRPVFPATQGGHMRVLLGLAGRLVPVCAFAEVAPDEVLGPCVDAEGRHVGPADPAPEARPCLLVAPTVAQLRAYDGWEPPAVGLQRGLLDFFLGRGARMGGAWPGGSRLPSGVAGGLGRGGSRVPARRRAGRGSAAGYLLFIASMSRCLAFLPIAARLCTCLGRLPRLLSRCAFVARLQRASAGPGRLRQRRPQRRPGWRARMRTLFAQPLPMVACLRSRATP